jgi:hypothetical protein
MQFRVVVRRLAPIRTRTADTAVLATPAPAENADSSADVIDQRRTGHDDDGTGGQDRDIRASTSAEGARALRSSRAGESTQAKAPGVCGVRQSGRLCARGAAKSALGLAVNAKAQRQGLSLVHLSAQLEPCLTQENTLHNLNTS